MTVTPRTASYDATLTQQSGAAPARSSAATNYLAKDAKRDWKIWAVTMFVVAVMFGLLQNPYWVPAGDSEVYISVARSLLQGEGLTFNSQPVAMVPPGWPAAMAIVMMFTTSFLVLKIFTAACMWGALAISIWICRRFVTAGWAAFVILAMASLSHVYQATFWLISEGLFCLLTSWALLLTFHIKERTAAGEKGAQGWWRFALLGVICAVAVLVRWAGILSVLPIGAILFNRERIWPVRVNRLWVALFVACFTAGTTFQILRTSMSGWDTGESAPLAGGAAAASGGEEAGGGGTGGGIVVSDRLVSMQYSILSGSGAGGTTYSDRFVGWGRWFSWLYWQPFRAGMGDPLIDLGAQFFGWLIIFLMIFAAGYGVARLEWMWLAMLVYCASLSLNWPNVNSRYYVPIFFLLLIGMLRAGEGLRSFGNKWWRGLVTFLLWMFLGSFVLTNTLLWMKDVQVARSADFYHEYEAGINEKIISACKFLGRDDLGPGAIAVTPSYINLGKKRQSQFALRVTHMLTDKPIVNLPKEKQVAPEVPRLAWWLQNYGIRWYLHQHAISPWRVWHYRVPKSVQERMQGSPVEDIEAGYTLYRLVPSVPAIPGVIDEVNPSLIRIDTPPSEGWPTRVPAL
jgi:hypothetical protein